jgi:RHS repeat-associated protein
MAGFVSFVALMLCLLMAAVSGYADTSIINEYDANGNLVTGDGRYYEYNDANQLSRVRQGDKNGPVIAEYFYDSSGQRVKKIENGVVTYYIGKHYEKQVGGSNEGSTSYYFGEGGERVAKKDPGGNILYYHLDHLDGVNVVTDASGKEVSRTAYLPFGDVTAGSSGSDKYSYTGKEKDKTDLYYFEARYNSPEFKHFTQADLAEPDYTDPQDLNRYSYVGNNPLSYVDYDGFKKKKKAKLSKREKWMIAHGSDPDHDKTPLKKAKAQLKAGTKYTTAAKAISMTASSAKSDIATGLESFTLRASSKTPVVTIASYQNSGARVLGASTKKEADYSRDAKDELMWTGGMIVCGILSIVSGDPLIFAGCEAAHKGKKIAGTMDKTADALESWVPAIKDAEGMNKGKAPETGFAGDVAYAECKDKGAEYEKCMEEHGW